MAQPIPGAMELAMSIRGLAIDGRPIFSEVTLKDPRVISTGGRQFSPRLSVIDQSVAVDVFTTSYSQRIIAAPAIDLAAARSAVEQLLSCRSPL